MEFSREFKHGDLVYEVCLATKRAILIRLKRNIFYKDECDERLMGRMAWYHPCGEVDRETIDYAIFYATDEVRDALEVLFGKDRVCSKPPKPIPKVWEEMYFG